jgi:hypothetical protein
LKEAIERDKAAATSPPITTMPVGGAPSEGREPPATSPPPVSQQPGGVLFNLEIGVRYYV